MRTLSFAVSLVLTACGSGDSPDMSRTDASTSDAGAKDASASDAGANDANERPSITDAGAVLRVPDALPPTPSDCPQIVEGDVQFGGAKVRVWLGDDGASRLGPLVVYWHGTCSNAAEASFGLGADGIARIKALGGMVAAIDSPYKSPDDFCASLGIAATSKCPGTSTGNGVWCREDFDLADRITACAVAQVGIDPRRIHTVGMSAGGVMAVEYADARSGYIASITSYSGGALPGPLGAPVEDASNKFAAMIVYGGASDIVGAANFEQLGTAYQAELTARGQFSFLCDHGMGHTIPRGIGASTVRFFEDHPFGVSPEPYAEALPASFPDYCRLP